MQYTAGRTCILLFHLAYLLPLPLPFPQLLLSFSSSDSHKSSLRGKKNIAMPSVASVDQFLWRNYLIFACCSAMPSHSESRSLAQVVLDSG